MLEINGQKQVEYMIEMFQGEWAFITGQIAMGQKYYLILHEGRLEGISGCCLRC